MFVFHSIHLIFICKILMANKMKVTATNFKTSSLVLLIPDQKFVAVEYYRFAIILWALIAGYLAESPCFPRQGLRHQTAPPRSPVQNWYPGVCVSASPVNCPASCCTSRVVGGAKPAAIIIENTKLNTWILQVALIRKKKIPWELWR